MASSKDEAIEVVRKLLAKAENTNFGPESEAFVEAAHRLMAKWSIEQAVLHAASGVKDAVVFKEVKNMQGGFLPDHRMILLGVVSKLNRCRIVISGDFINIFGYEHDVDYVVMMFRSLVLQATEAMLSDPGNKAKGFGENFFDGFTWRIEKRLAAAQAEIEAELEVQGSSSMALVLASNKEAVDTAIEKKFGKLGTAKVRRYTQNADAHAKGKAAADKADITTDDQKIAGGGRKELS